MKNRTLTAIIALTGLALLFAACSKTESINESLVDVEKSMELVTAPDDSCMFTGTLTETEKEGLIEMREEEKLARDVYLKFYEIYRIPTFNNISKSENAHTSAVLHLINGYGIEDPALEAVGEFTNTAFGELYKSLTEQGSENLVAALKVGAFIEEYDIADLWRLLDETQNENIKRVYANLLRGSTFHMLTFTNLLKVKGETYTPTIISNEEYLEILSK
jgi:hypothetical protein